MLAFLMSLASFALNWRDRQYFLLPVNAATMGGAVLAVRWGRKAARLASGAGEMIRQREAFARRHQLWTAQRQKSRWS